MLRPGLKYSIFAYMFIPLSPDIFESFTSGGTVIERTSGNMGTGLAIVCAVKGYKFVAVMSEELAIKLNAYSKITINQTIIPEWWFESITSPLYPVSC